MKNKILEKALKLTESKRIDERTSPLPKATAFSLLFSYAGKDHKFVSKLTDIGGKLDRKKKEVYFDFTSAAARTKFRKKHKDIIKSLSESVEHLDEGKTEFAVVATASKMLIKAFPTEKQARQYIKNQYTRKSLIGNLAIMEVPKSRPPGNQMKGDMEVVKESVEHLDEGLTARHLSMSGEGRELWLYIDNDAQLYKQQGLPIIKNLMTKKAQGKYDSKLAVKLYMYLVDNGAKK